MTHAGHSYAGRSPDEMARIAEAERLGVVQAAQRLRGAGLRIDEDAAVHLLILDFDPLATQTNFTPLIGRAVKALGKCSGNISRNKPCILALNWHGSMVGNIG